MESKPTDVIGRAAASLFPKAEEKPVLRIAEQKPESSSAAHDSIPQIRIKAEEKGEAVKKFATATSAEMHLKVVKAKRATLTAMHKVVSLLVRKKDDGEDK